MNNGLLSTVFLPATDLTDAAWFKYVLWWSIPLTFAGLFAVSFVIYKLVRTVGAARIYRVALAADCELDINAAGKLYLCLEVPMFTLMRGGNLQYELFDARAGGKKVELKTVWFKARTNSGATSTSPIRAFEIEAPGKYRLKVSGFKPQADYSSYSLIVSRPINLKLFLYVLAIILTGMMFVAGLVFSLIASGADK